MKIQSLLKVLVAFILASGLNASSAPKEAVSKTPKPKPLTEWYYAGGLIMPEGTGPSNAVHGASSPSDERLCIFNMTSKASTATLTYYFEDMEPRQTVRKLLAQAPVSIAIHEEKGTPIVPQMKLYAIKVQSETPIIVQPTRSEWQEGVIEGKAAPFTASFVAYSGPLGQKEIRWAYADCQVTQGGALDESEWITILNPNAGKDAKVKITFNYAGGRKTHVLAIPAERVRTVELGTLPDSDFKKKTTCSPVIESNVPIIVEISHRSSSSSSKAPRGMRSTLAYPIGDQKSE